MVAFLGLTARSGNASALMKRRTVVLDNPNSRLIAMDEAPCSYRALTASYLPTRRSRRAFLSSSYFVSSSEGDVAAVIAGDALASSMLAL